MKGETLGIENWKSGAENAISLQSFLTSRETNKTLRPSFQKFEP